MKYIPFFSDRFFLSFTVGALLTTIGCTQGEELANDSAAENLGPTIPFCHREQDQVVKAKLVMVGRPGDNVIVRAVLETKGSAELMPATVNASVAFDWTHVYNSVADYETIKTTEEITTALNQDNRGQGNGQVVYNGEDVRWSGTIVAAEKSSRDLPWGGALSVAPFRQYSNLKATIPQGYEAVLIFEPQIKDRQVVARCYNNSTVNLDSSVITKANAFAGEKGLSTSFTIPLDAENCSREGQQQYVRWTARFANNISSQVNYSLSVVDANNNSNLVCVDCRATNSTAFSEYLFTPTNQSKALRLDFHGLSQAQVDSLNVRWVDNSSKTSHFCIPSGALKASPAMPGSLPTAPPISNPTTNI